VSIAATTADSSSEEYLRSTVNVPHVRESLSVVPFCLPPANASVFAPTANSLSEEYLRSTVDVSSTPHVRVPPNVVPSCLPPTSAPVTASNSSTSSDEYLRSLVSFQSFALHWLLSILLNLPPSVLPAADGIDVSLRRVLVASPHWPESITNGETMDLRELLLLLQPHLIQHVTGVRRH